MSKVTKELSKVNEGATFEVAGYEFIKFSDRDGETIVVSKDCLFCFCGNSRWYGGGFMAAPLAQPDDGLLDFIIVRKDMPVVKFLKEMNNYKAGKHLSWDRTIFKR